MATDLKKIKAKCEKFFGKGYLEFLLAAGVACDMDSEVLAKELDTTVATVEELRLNYESELEEVGVYSAVLSEIIEDLQRIRFVKLASDLTDSLFSDLKSGELSPKEKAGLFTFLVKHLATKEKVGKDKRRELSPEQVRARIHALKTA